MKALQFWSVLSVIGFFLLLVIGLAIIDRWTKK